VEFGSSYNFHLKGSSNKDPNIPSNIQYIKESPAFSTYYNDNSSYGLGISYNFEENNGKVIFLKLSLEKSILENKISESELFLGKKIDITSFNFYLGLGFPLENKVFNPNIFIGISSKNYQGSSIINDIHIKNNYSRSPFFTIGGAIDIENLKIPIGITLGSKFEFGNVKREKIEFKYLNEPISTAEPTGDLELQDNTFSIYISIYYKLKL
jgi:hypothetical protein